METGIITALSAVMGSVVGGSATIATAWITQKTQSKRELGIAEGRKREVLYSEFIVECTRLALDSFTHTLDRPETMMSAFAMKNRIRLTSSDAVVKAADHTLTKIIEQYHLKNLTTEELRVVAESEDADPLREFSEACRKELRAFQNL